MGEHEPVEATSFPSSSHTYVSEASIWGNLTEWETSGSPFETEQLDLFVFEEAIPVELPPIKKEEDKRSLFLVGA
ncbi:hypothetical protein F6Y03_02640 [Bacillus megaterium]|nr:hypothetical protein [Priestia megaterium]